MALGHRPALLALRQLSARSQESRFLFKAGSIFCQSKKYMPLLKVETSVALSDEKRKGLLSSLSEIVAKTIGKPEQYVMVSINSAAMLMSAKPGDAAFVDVRSIGGLSNDVNRQLSQQVCALLKESLGIPPERVYLNFTDVEAEDWGWKGNTFG